MNLIEKTDSTTKTLIPTQCLQVERPGVAASFE